ncbi:MAG: cytochrome b561/polyisoprenoid-binding protein YceI [Gammaproteobacteria bacterium]|jgi:cytochrome b561/polyisoprenoid-binding protein YceI
MPIAKRADRYDLVARTLHWLIAALIVTQYVLGELAERAAGSDQLVAQLGLLANHKSVGITILALAVVRLFWRFVATPPALPATMPAWQHRASQMSHWLLYLFLFALPVTGWMMSSAASFTVSWFGLFELPNLVGANEALSESLQDVHHILASALLAIAIIHIAAALKHHFIDRDDVLRRMSSFAGIALFVVVAIGAIAMLSNPGRSPAPNTGLETRSQTRSPTTSLHNVAPASPVATLQTHESALPRWVVGYTHSTITFTSEQAGGAFDGIWRSWQADLRFDPGNLEASRFDVTIKVGSVDTKSADRDQTMMQAEWFDRANYPNARFTTEQIRANADGSYTADAFLTIKGKSTPVTFDFTVREVDGRQTLEGTSKILNGGSRLDRLALALGTGQWATTDDIGQFVTVKVHVDAVVPAR